MSVALKQLAQEGATVGQSLIWGGTEWGVGGELTDLHTVLARRSTTYVLTGTYVGLTLDVTDIETDTAVAQHNDTNTERIDLKQAGLYLITYDIDVDLTASAAPEARVVANGTTEVLGSYDNGKIGSNNSKVSMSTTIAYNATADDYIEVQVRDLAGSPGTIRINSVVQVVRMAGKTGPAGPPGSGTDNDAIHDNVSGEISAIAEKTSPVGDDWLVIEDSAASNAKKKVKVSSLPAGVVTYTAIDFLSPNNADWAVNALAPLGADSNNAGLSVRLFDDTVEEGVGTRWHRVPTWATSVNFKFVSRGETAPAGARTLAPKVYNRNIPDNAAVGSWSAGVTLNDIDIPTNENFQYDEQTVTLATLGVTAGELVQFQVTRVDPSAGTELSGDWALLQLDIGFV
jgi:hypothetical protein